MDLGRLENFGPVRNPIEERLITCQRIQNGTSFVGQETSRVSSARRVHVALGTKSQMGGPTGRINVEHNALTLAQHPKDGPVQCRC